jgi:hypothetical protein
VFCTGAASRNVARDGCVLVGLDLVTIESAPEAAYLESRVTLPIWIGPSDVTIEGEWLWPDGTPLAGSYENWANGEPSVTASGHDCALWQSGGWNDVACSGSFPFVCRDP